MSSAFSPADLARMEAATRVTRERIALQRAAYLLTLSRAKAEALAVRWGWASPLPSPVTE